MYSAVGMLVNIGVPVILQICGQVGAAPWPVQVALWILFITLRLDLVQKRLGGGSLEQRNGWRTGLGCLIATLAVCCSGVPELTASVCGLVLAVHLQWHLQKALVVGGLATTGLAAITGWASGTGMLPHATGSIAPWLSLAAYGYSMSMVGNLAFLAVQQHGVRTALRYTAERDPLTGLLNRRALDAALEVAAAGAGPGCGVGVLFCDVDHFKAVNDQHGHAAGDAVLLQVASRLSAGTRGGTAIGRIGGDEFVIVVGDLAELGHAEVVAQNLRENACGPFVVDGVVVGGGVSIGVFATDQPTTAQALLAGADAAMYAAKQSAAKQSSPSTRAMPESKTSASTFAGSSARGLVQVRRPRPGQL